MITQRVGNAGSRRARRTSAVATACGLALLAAQAATPAFAGATEQAERIYERLAGVQPSPGVLAQMVQAINNQPGQAGLLAAAAIATDPKTAPDVLQRGAEEHGDAVDESQSDGVRTVQ
jgi:hypothetical protein